jgi:hypothetical protein
VIKHNFDQTPKLLETFDQLIRSSEIRSSDPLSVAPIIFCLKFQIFGRKKLLEPFIDSEILFNLLKLLTN